MRFRRGLRVEANLSLVPMIDRMAEEGIQIGLAVSLHAATDEVRRQLAELEYSAGSKAAQTALAENYVGLPY